MDTPTSNNPALLPPEGSGYEVTDIQMVTEETSPITDVFPEASVPDQDDDADINFYDSSGLPSNMVSLYGLQHPTTPTFDPDKLPYSYMVEYAGRVPKVLSILDPDVKAWVHKIRNPPNPICEKTDDTPAFNIAGEEALERRFRQIPNPVNYLIVVRGFKLLMAIRNMTIENKAPYVSSSYAHVKTSSLSVAVC